MRKVLPIFLNVYKETSHITSCTNSFSGVKRLKLPLPKVLFLSSRSKSAFYWMQLNIHLPANVNVL